MNIAVARRAVLLRPPAAAFTPPSGAILWLKADALVPVADATNVATWTDSSGAGNDATAVGTTPKYYGSVVNGKPVIRWAAGDSRYNSAASASDAAQTIIAVAKIADLAGDRTFLGASANGGLGFYAATNGALRIIQQGVTFPLGGAAGVATTGAFRVWTAVASSGANAIYKDGTLTDSSTNSFTLTSSLTSVVGAQGSTSIFSGDIAEVFRFNRALTSTERIAVHTYLGAKYGITMGGA